MSTETQEKQFDEAFTGYTRNRSGLKQYLYDLADDLFPFDGYRDYQDEILYGSLEALFVDGYTNVIVDGPTGIGKSPINVTIGRIVKHLKNNKKEVEEYFNYLLDGIETGQSFYTTPQKQLRNQLAHDTDLAKYVKMLKSRQDYICEASGENCKDCSLASEDEDASCRTIPGCTYWAEKVRAMDSDIATITFAMLVVDNYLPPQAPDGSQLSFMDRDVVIVDEGHNLEGQVASLFAGFNVSSWMLPDEVYQNANEMMRWSFEEFSDVEHILDALERRAKQFIKDYEDVPHLDNKVEKCENFVRKVEYCRSEIAEGRPWVVTMDSLGSTDEKKMTLKPVDVDKFLKDFVWSRGNKRIISSATIPYRDDIDQWAERIGLDGSTKLIGRPMPFPEENRTIYTNTIVGSLSGDGEEEHWDEIVESIEEIHSHHKGENGLIHTVSYKRAEELADALGHENVIVQDREKDKELIIQDWCESEKDILLSPSMMEGVDLHGDRCRWQVLAKVPYAYVGDSRVSHLLNKRHDWQWYNETASLNVQQSVGRAVRGPEDEEASSYYVIDGSFDKLMNKTKPPDWFTSAIRHHEPDHWDEPRAAPWR